MRNADDALASAGEHFIRSSHAARERRRMARLIDRLWQDNHFQEGFLAPRRAGS